MASSRYLDHTEQVAAIIFRAQTITAGAPVTPGMHAKNSIDMAKKEVEGNLLQDFFACREHIGFDNNGTQIVEEVPLNMIKGYTLNYFSILNLRYQFVSFIAAK